MFFADGMVCAMDGIFDIPDHGVHPFEYLELIILSAAAGNDRFMTALGAYSSDSGQPFQSDSGQSFRWEAGQGFR